MQHGRRDARVVHEGLSKLTGRRARLGTAADALAEIQAGTDLSHAAPPRWPGEQVPRDVEREYGALHAFVLSIADADVRAELLELLYPLFVNCFFVVVRHHHNPEVRARFAPSEMVDFVQFFARYAPTFRAVHGDELGAVFSCRTIAAMTFSPVHRRFCRERYRVRVSTAALSVALGFLYDHCCTIVLTKLFQRLLIRTVPALPHAARDMRLFVSDTQHEAAAAAVLRAAGPIALDVPPDLAVLSVAAMRGREAAHRVDSSTDAGAGGASGSGGGAGAGTGEDEETSGTHKKGRRGRKKRVRNEDGDGDDNNGATTTTTTTAATAEDLEGDGSGLMDDFGGGGAGSDENNDDYDYDYYDEEDEGGGDGTVPLYRGSRSRRARVVFPPAVQALLRNSRICARATRLGAGAGAALPSVCLSTVHDASDTVACMAVGATGALVAAGHTTGAVRVWAPGDARQVTEAFLPPPRCTLRGHSGAVTSVAPSLDAQYLLSAAADGTARLWCVPLARALATYAAWAPREPLWAAQFAPAGDAFVACAHDRTARLFATNFLHPVRVFADHEADVTAAAFHPGGALLATGSADCTVRLWDIGTGRTVRLLVAQGHPVTAVALSPDGRHAAAGSRHGDISVWDLAAGTPVRRLVAHAGAPVHSLAFSTDGRVLASGGADCTVRLWDTAPAALAPPPGAAARRVPPAPDDAGCLAVLRTKQTPVHAVQFTLSNLLMAAGPFLETHAESYLAP